MRMRLPLKIKSGKCGVHGHGCGCGVLPIIKSGKSTIDAMFERDNAILYAYSDNQLSMGTPFEFLLLPFRLMRGDLNLI